MTSRAAFIAVMLGASSLLAGCEGALIDSNANGDQNGADAGNDDEDPAALARAFYDTNVEADLKAACAPCHGDAGTATKFLMGDAYATLKATPNFIVPGDADGSRLYSYGRSEAHSGPELAEDLAERIKTWIEMEPDADEAPPLIETQKFTPVVGANTVDLSGLGAGLEGASLTFDASMLSGGIYLTKLTLVAGVGGLHIEHPLFVTYCPDAATDPVDSFYGLDQTLNPSTTGQLGGGSVILVGAGAACEASLHFKVIKTGKIEDGGLGGGCTNVAGFTAMARGPLQTSCTNGACHATAGSGAANSFDLTKIADMSAAGQAAACAQTRGKMNLANEAMSLLFQRVTPPQSTGHPFTFAAGAPIDNFRNAVTGWATTEQ